MKVKYPRTWHLPYSPNPGGSDKVHTSDEHFKDKEVVVSIKMDGENTSVYKEYSHARSLDSKLEESRRWIEMWRELNKEFISADERICGENMFWKHTVEYGNLESVFYIFSIWKDKSCYSYDDTYSYLLGLSYCMHVPVIYTGIYDSDTIIKNYELYKKDYPSEGFVVRLANSFHYDDFKYSVSKFVDNEFTLKDDDKHWFYSVKTQNKLKHGENFWTIFDSKVT